jgi:N-methylhydantoinase B
MLSLREEATPALEKDSMKAAVGSGPGRPRVEVSPIELEVIKGALVSARREMDALIERTAMSPVIREKKDFFTGVFDARGRPVITTELPIFGGMVDVVTSAYPVEDMRPGDVYWFNDLYISRGAISHTSDQALIAPIFYDDTLVGFTMSVSHFLDIGGSAPGSISPAATELFHEGTMVPPVRLARAGAINEDLLRVFVRNSRVPEVTKNDLMSLMSALKLGQERLIELMDRYSAATVGAAFERLGIPKVAGRDIPRRLL